MLGGCGWVGLVGWWGGEAHYRPACLRGATRDSGAVLTQFDWRVPASKTGLPGALTVASPSADGDSLLFISSDADDTHIPHGCT